jgi:aspartyl-tRNA synthetase
MLTNINKLKINQVKTIQGFVENIRNKPNICFLVIKDVTGMLQITILKEKNPQFNPILEKLTPQSVITIKGKLMQNTNVKLNGVEFIPN